MSLNIDRKETQTGEAAAAQAVTAAATIGKGALFDLGRIVLTIGAQDALSTLR